MVAVFRKPYSVLLDFSGDHKLCIYLQTLLSHPNTWPLSDESLPIMNSILDISISISNHLSIIILA